MSPVINQPNIRHTIVSVNDNQMITYIHIEFRKIFYQNIFR